MSLEPSAGSEPLRFQFSALVQASALSGEGPHAPAIPWALTYSDSFDQEVFYLANTDLLRQFPAFLNKLRALPENAAIAQEMLNQGLPCFLYLRRGDGALYVNVTQYRDGRDALFKEDLIFTWEEFVGLVTLASRRFLTELAAQYPRLRRFLNGPIASFNEWTTRWHLVPFQPPPDVAGDFEPVADTRGKKRRAPLELRIYLQEWKNHKDANLRMNAVLLASLGILAAFLFLAPLARIPLGFWLMPLAVIAIPWWLVARYPVLPLDSPLWLEDRINYRVFYLDSVILIAGLLLWLAASRHEADLLWLWLFPLGWLLCLFAGLGFPATHWARPLWDWSRVTILLSLLFASGVLWLLADIGHEFASSLDPERSAPRVVIVQTPLADSVQQWQTVPLRDLVLPLARNIDQYTVKRRLTEWIPQRHPLRQPLGEVLRWAWVFGLAGYSLGLYWAQLPSPRQITVHSTPVS